jgi:hypothetical protein
MEMGGQLHAPASLPRGYIPRYVFCRRLGGSQSWTGCGDEKIPYSCRQPNPGSQARSLVTILAEISGLP